MEGNSQSEKLIIGLSIKKMKKKKRKMWCKKWLQKRNESDSHVKILCSKLFRNVPNEERWPKKSKTPFLGETLLPEGSFSHIY